VGTAALVGVSTAKLLTKPAASTNRAAGNRHGSSVAIAEAQSDATVHQKGFVTVAYRVTDPDGASAAIRIIIRRANGSVAQIIRIAARQPTGRPLSYRFRVALEPGTYTWFVRAASGQDVATSARGAALTVLPPLVALFPTADNIARAGAYLQARNSHSALAVVDSHGDLHGYNLDKQFVSASVIKAMLLVQYLRTHATLSEDMKDTLTQMITRSNNAAAYKTFGLVGAGGLYSLAGTAGMKHLTVGQNVIFSYVTAGDQARFFFNMDSYIPSQHRAFAHFLLSHIIDQQSWGIPRVARPSWQVFFKGGWIGPKKDPFTLVNQVARLQRGDLTWSMAVLTSGNPGWPYGPVTLEGVAQRLLAGAPDAEAR
jgi:hypothetical protein